MGCLFFLVRAWFGLEDRAGPPSDLPMHARRLLSPPPASTRRFVRRAGRRVLPAGVAQLAEHLFCKQVVGGSSPPASSTISVFPGGLPERPKGAGCKPAGIAYVGSNPTPSTRNGSVSRLGEPFAPLNNKSAIARGGIVEHNSRPSVLRGSSSTGRASAFQAERRGFESLLPLYGAHAAQRIGWPT